jgi:hypothetical protein
MNAIPTVPLTITPEAGVRVAELGMQVELEQMLDRAQQIVPGLKRMNVELAERYDLGGEPGVTVRVFHYEEDPLEEDLESVLGSWMTRSFPPKVCGCLVILIDQENEYAR